ncbi:MAG: malate dehydrogenase [Desulfobacteraceae bacterium]|jgi:malate dehydrogenase
MKIAIVGAAGSVGSPAAFYIAAQGLADEILMIGGKKQNVLKQHAMDLSTAVSALDIKVRAGGYEDLPGSDIVINAAGVAQGLIKDRMEVLPKNIPLIKGIAEQIRQHCPEAIVITATNPVGPLNYTTYLAGGFERKQLIGYSINDSFRLREMIARAFNVKVSQVEGTVIGEHGPTQVLLFSSVKIDGQPVTVGEEIKESIRAEVPNILKRYEEFQAGRTAGWTCAIGLAAFVRAIVHDTGEVLPCSLLLDGEYGQKNLSMSVPARIGREGVKEILEWDLAPDEVEGLKISTEKLTAAMKLVEKELK